MPLNIAFEEIVGLRDNIANYSSDLHSKYIKSNVTFNIYLH